MRCNWTFCAPTGRATAKRSGNCASLKVAIAASLIGAIVGELPTGAIQGLGARMLIGSQFGEPLIMWSALFAAAIMAGFLILIVGLAERFAKARMGGIA